MYSAKVSTRDALKNVSSQLEKYKLTLITGLEKYLLHERDSTAVGDCLTTEYVITFFHIFPGLLVSLSLIFQDAKLDCK